MKAPLSILGTASQVQAASMPSGALGLWYADQYAATPRPQIPNAAVGQTLNANLLSFPRGPFSLNNGATWIGSGITATDNAGSAPDGTASAARLVGTGNWFIPAKNSTLPAGNYLLAVWAKRYGATDQVFCFSKDYAASRSSVFTATSSWQRFTYPFTLASAGDTGNLMLINTGSTNADLLICDLELFAGSADLTAASPTSNLILGPTAFTGPTVAGGEINLSGQYGAIRLPSAMSAGANTVMAIVSKVVAGSAYHAILSKMQAYTSYSAYSDVSNTPQSTVGGDVSFQGAGLWTLLNKGYHMLTHRYDGATRELWIDDVRLFVKAGTAGAVAVQDLFVGLTNNTGFTTGLKMQGLALYDRALTDAEIRTSFAAFRARITVDVSLNYNIYCAEGDSITSPTSGTGYPLLFGPNATTTTFGAVRAVPGSTIADMVARATLTDAMIPLAKGGRKFLLSVLIGRNDLTSLGTSTWLTNLASYLDARRAAGWTVALGTILPSTASGFNAARNTANTTLRAWVGTHCDAIIDFAANGTMGPDAAASNTTYYNVDGTHPTAAGQVILETVARPILNAL